MRKRLMVLAGLGVLAVIGLTAGLLLRGTGRDGPGREVGPLDAKMPRPLGFATPAFRRVGLIRIAFTGAGLPGMQRSRDEARDIIRRVHGMVVRGELAFTTAAARFSDDPSRAEKGDLGFVTLEQLHERNLPAPEKTLALDTGGLSEVIISEGGFFLYTILPYERKYFRASFISFEDPGTEGMSEDQARTKAYKIYNNIMAGRDRTPGPAGYIGEVTAGIPHKMIPSDSIFHEQVKDLKEGDVSGVFKDGQRFIIAQRCAPMQFTFSFIMFLGNTQDPDEHKRLMDESQRALEQVRSGPDAFYRFALKHYQAGTWNTPWYRVSKDLYLNELQREVYAFLNDAQVGDISDILVFDTAIVILLKEEFIGPR